MVPAESPRPIIRTLFFSAGFNGAAGWYLRRAAEAAEAAERSAASMGPQVGTCGESSIAGGPARRGLVASMGPQVGTAERSLNQSMSTFFRRFNGAAGWYLRRVSGTAEAPEWMTVSMGPQVGTAERPHYHAIEAENYWLQWGRRLVPAERVVMPMGVD